MLGIGLELACRLDEVVVGPALAAAAHVQAGHLVEVRVKDWSPEPEALWLCCNADRVLARVQRVLVEKCTSELAAL